MSVILPIYKLLTVTAKQKYRLFFLRSIAQFLTQIYWVNSGKFLDNCWIPCQFMADMKKVYDDLMIINLYFCLKKAGIFLQKLKYSTIHFLSDKKCYIFKSFDHSIVTFTFNYLPPYVYFSYFVKQPSIFFDFMA